MNIPKLRFKGFNDEWKNKKLKKVTNLLKDGTHGSYLNTDNSNYYLLSAKNIKHGLICINDDERHISKNDFDDIFKNYSLENHDILLTIVGTIGKLAIFNQKKNYYAFQRSVAIIRFNDIDIYYKYAFSYMHTYKFQIQLKSKTTLSAQGGIYLNDLKELFISYPSLEEQQKIGALFAKLDNLIDLQAKKLELLKQLKQGLLQRLFPQNNQTTPQLRFKGFNDKWGKNTLVSLCEKVKAGGTPTSSNKEYYGEGNSFLSISDMSSNGKYINKVSKSITDKGLNNSSAWILEKNNLLLSMYASIGKVAINKDDITFSQAIVGIIPKKNISLEFLYQYMNYLQLINYYRFLISEGTQKNLNIQKIKNINIMIPQKIEQNLIGSLLANLDNLLTKAQEKITLFKQVKKYLLQRMFI